MARAVQCAYLKKEAEGMDYAPYPGELGKRIYQEISKEAWQLWMRHQTMLVNENRLNLADKKARDYLVTQMEKHFFGEPQANKVARREAKGRVKADVKAWLIEAGLESDLIPAVLSNVEWFVEEEVVTKILDENRRVDGRGIHDIRTLTSEVALFKRAHGSGLFSRGETQVLTVATLGSTLTWAGFGVALRKVLQNERQA